MVTIVTKMITIAMVPYSLKKNLDMLLCMIETSSVPPQKSSETFGNLRKISEKCSESFTFQFPSLRICRSFSILADLMNRKENNHKRNNFLFSELKTIFLELVPLGLHSGRVWRNPNFFAISKSR